MEAGSPISVAKAVKNTVGQAATALQRPASLIACASWIQLQLEASLWTIIVARNRKFSRCLGWGFC